MNKKKYAVITGDLIKSSVFSDKEIRGLMNDLRSSFSDRINSLLKDEIISKFSVFRGDSFQAVAVKPEYALHSMILIRCFIKKKYENIKTENKIDARISLGIGVIENYSENDLKDNVSEWTGEAFNLSGKALDSIKTKNINLVAVTPWEEVDKEISVFLKMIDYLISRWSREQVVAIIGLIEGKSQTDMAKELNITQPAVRKRLKTAGSEVIQAILDRYEKLIKKNICRS